MALALAAMLALLYASAVPARGQSPSGQVVMIAIDGAIGVASERYLARGLARARDENAAALLVRLDTPGGLVSITREMVSAIVGSRVPVIVYVGPSGARAASAGTFLVYAAHLAAMAPGTNLGAATPVSLGFPGGSGAEDKKDNDAGTQKALNDTVALLRSLAQMRGRNIEFAEKAVREAATLTADEALRDKVVEFVASDVRTLLVQADGRTVTTAAGERTLATRDATLVTMEPGWRTRLLAVVGDPNIAYILLLVGIYGLLFEFWNPGTFVPGVIGGISLLLALVALSALPVRYGALALLVLGVGLMVAEAFTPGIGALGIGGIVAFIVGSVYLFEPEAVDLSLSLPLIIGATAACALLTMLVVGAVVGARRRPVATGAEQMIGMRVTVLEWQDGRGNVRVHGEIWSARSDAGLRPGDTARVRGRDGLTLSIEPE